MSKETDFEQLYACAEHGVTACNECLGEYTIIEGEVMSAIKQNCGDEGCYKDCPAPCQHDEIMKDTAAETDVRLILASEGYFLTDAELRVVARKLKAVL